MNLNGTMANSSKKRKASDLESDVNGKHLEQNARPGQKRRQTGSKSTDEILFRTQCPYRPSRKVSDVYVQKEEIVPEFEFQFSVRPGLKWKNMRQYRNVKLQDHTFSVGTVIYINKQDPPPKSPPPDASDGEMLEYDRSNFWVGRIADTRAETDKAVFLRIYWLYWPEELPMGRQSYHGERELVQSNAMDIINAQTISGAAELSHWDERELDHEYLDRFWRQTFDVSQLGKNQKGGLSELRKHCSCQQPHNPDRAMFQCKRPSCLTWNHDECLVKDVLQRIWPIYEKDRRLDALDSDTITADASEPDSSLQQQILNPVKQLGKMMQARIAPPKGKFAARALSHSMNGKSNGTETLSKGGKTTKKIGRSNTPATVPWEGKLTASLVNTDDRDEESPILAKVEEVKREENKLETGPCSVRVSCLVCGNTM